MKCCRFFLLMCLCLLGGQGLALAELLAKSNVAAWCIVPFDAKKRGPEERAAMLRELGITRCAYDWREEHVASFEDEIIAYKKHGIEFFAFWGQHPAAFALFRKYNLHPQIWQMLGEPKGAEASQEARVAAAVQALRPLAQETAAMGCKLAIYNHGGWAGEPANMVAVCLALHSQGFSHVGIVYNFHHGHADVPQWKEKFTLMQPFLNCLNLNGMVIGGQKILPLGISGGEEAAMLRVVLDCGYTGPIGIIDHRPETDSAETLRENLAGLESLRVELAKPLHLQRAPLDAAVHPLHGEKVNRDRIYNFYLKQALAWQKQPATELSQYPGLDGGQQGHWGNQNEDVWRDGRWNDTDLGQVLAGVFRQDKLKVSKGVCVLLGEHGERAVCFDPESQTYPAVWQGGFLKFSDVRHGVMDGLAMRGTPVAETMPAGEPNRGKYRGYYRHGNRIIFAFQKPGQIDYWLESPWFEKGALVLETGENLRKLIAGGPSTGRVAIATQGTLGKPIPGWPFVIDTLTLPMQNPWKSLLFGSGHDFFANGDIAFCTMTGDVWRVSGVDANLGSLSWQRLATGLHQPLGLLVIDEKVHVLGRDQITRLHDLNADGEADFYECLTNEFETPTGGHDYLCGLERGKDGAFYTVSGRTGLLRIVPGKPTEVVASGFRNPDGLGLSPDGVITVPASEGEWTPASAIHQISPGSYHGYPGPSKTKPTVPTFLHLPRGVDNSAGGQAWVPHDQWGALAGHQLHLSYGTGNHFLVLRQQVNNVWQGAAVPLPGDFRSGAHRGRFSPSDGHFYVSGMTGWGTYTPDDGCLHRVRYTGGPMHLPTAFEARENGVLLTFSNKIELTAPPFAQCWNYRYARSYGSQEYKLSNPDQTGHDVLEITGVHPLKEGQQLFIEIPQLNPAGQVHLVLQLGKGITREMFLTLHQLAEPFTDYPNYKNVAKQPLGKPASATVAMAKTVPWEKGRQGPPGRPVSVQAAAGLQFVQKELTAKPGEPLSLTFENPDLIPHNWVLLNPGKLTEVGELANKYLTDPQAVANHYVPPSQEILCYTRIINEKESTTIHFTAPSKLGRYPYICTFPGHWMVMKGELIVAE